LEVQEHYWFFFNCQTAIPKGSPNPAAIEYSVREWQSEWYTGAGHTTESDESKSEEPSHRVEWKVASGALGIMVAAHTSRSRVEVAAGD